MLYNNRRSMIIWTPFKNYSTSIRFYFLEQMNSEWKEFIGYEPHTGLETKRFGVHANKAPSYYNHYKFILPIRNPYDRILSQWKFCSRCENTNFKFSEWFLKHGKYSYQLPVVKLYKYNTLLKVENIEEELKKINLHLGYPLPKLNTSPNPLNYELTQEDKDLIYFLHYEDFVAGGYEK